MGDMANFLLENEFDEWDENGDNLPKVIRCNLPKVIRCNHCNKKNLIWKNFRRKWYLFENDGNKIHICDGMQPPIEVLKVLAKQAMSEYNREASDKLFERARNPKNLTGLLNIIDNNQLVELYACFIRDAQLRYDNPDVGMPVLFDKQIEQIRKELLRRLNK